MPADERLADAAPAVVGPPAEAGRVRLGLQRRARQTGRGQLQYLASLFHPDGPNDVAPTGFNLQAPSPDLPRSPLKAEPHPTGFRWGTYDARRSIREPRVGGHGAE